jgi:ArsR family transcriptional regulator
MKQTVQVYKALADETRLRILSLLMTGELCVCNLMEVLQLPQSTVSRHLAYLRNTGWVEDRREGVWMYYSINEHGNAFQKELIAVLKRHLASLTAAVADGERLAAFLKINKCN